jgi:hypothetical protein
MYDKTGAACSRDQFSRVHDLEQLRDRYIQSEMNSVHDQQSIYITTLQKDRVADGLSMVSHDVGIN